MRIDMFGLGFDAPGVTFYLWSPWRASQLEHRLFDSLRQLSPSLFEQAPDELRLHIEDARVWRVAVQTISRVMKGWQEEAADSGGERRSWRWLVEADTDADGFDHTGEPTSFWAFLRASLDLNRPGEAEKGEDIDLDGFGVCVWGQTGKK